jgi:excinuclease UvrABC nuclease subunit
MEKKNNALAKVPHSMGLYKLYENEKLLFVGISSDINKRIKYFLEISELDNPDTNLLWTKQINNFKYETSTSMWHLFLKKNYTLRSEFPANQNQFNFYSQYVYLAINFKNPPFFKISEDTQGDAFYIGPFRERFFLIDILSILEKEFKAPICENNVENCLKIEQGNCLGFCVLNKEIFRKFVIKYILSKPNDKINKLEKRFDELEENLEFIESDEIKITLKKLNKFYNLMEGLILSKQLRYTWIEQNKKYEVERGKLLKIQSENNIEEFSSRIIEFRPNEIIAYEKSEIDEALIIFEHLKKSFPKDMKKLFAEAKKYILTKITED